MRVFWLALPALAMGAGVCWAAKAEKSQVRLPALLSEVEANYSKAGSFSAEFSQEEFSAAFGEKKASRGTLAWKSPNLLHWETKSPEANLLVSNGKTLWVYTPPFDESEHGQVIIRSAAAMKNRLIDALLAGRFSAALQQGLKIAPLKSREFLLQPSKKSGTGLKQDVVTIGAAEPVISRVSLEYLDGNKSTIDLTTIKMGQNLPKTLFDFKIPPRTDVVKE